jgi:4-hydroxy-tetrahydrodipicolinate synthase
MNSPTGLRGVLPVFQTPYYEDESVDFETLEREIDWLFEVGADGVVMAMASEITRLSDQERREMAEAVCRYCRGRGSVVISVGADSSKTAEQLAVHAQTAGADAVMAIPPLRAAVGEAELIRYFRRIAGATDLPVIVQDPSGYTGSQPLPLSLYTALLDEYGERIYFKPEATPPGPRLSAIRDRTGSGARLFGGTGGISFVDCYRRGLVGTMPGSGMADAFIVAWRHLQAGEDNHAYRLTLPFCALVALHQGIDGFLIVEKIILKRRGIFKNTLIRGPNGFIADAETIQEIHRLTDMIIEEMAQGRQS